MLLNITIRDVLLRFFHYLCTKISTLELSVCYNRMAKALINRNKPKQSKGQTPREHDK